MTRLQAFKFQIEPMNAVGIPFRQEGEDVKKTIFVTAEGLSNNKEDALLILEISRESIASGNISRVLEKLHILTDSEINVRLYRYALSICFTGYDSDSREIVEIPEIRSYMKALNEAWPHWLWYLSRGTGAIPLVMSLLCPVEIVRMQGGFTMEYKDFDSLLRTLDDMISRGNALFCTYELSVQDAKECAESAAAELLGGR